MNPDPRPPAPSPPPATAPATVGEASSFGRPFASRFALRLGLCLFVVQALVIVGFWQERFLAQVVLQILAPIPREHASDRQQALLPSPSLEGLRALLNRPDLANEVRSRFPFPVGSCQQPLLPTRDIETIPNGAILAFRLRHREAVVAASAAAFLLARIGELWAIEQTERVRLVLAYEREAFQRQLAVTENVLATLPRQRETSLGLASGGGRLPGLVMAQPFPPREDLERTVIQLTQRLRELAQLEHSYRPLPIRGHSWIVLAPPTVPTLPVWPTRFDLLLLALANSAVWAIAGGFFRPLATRGLATRTLADPAA